MAPVTHKNLYILSTHILNSVALVVWIPRWNTYTRGDSKSHYNALGHLRLFMVRVKRVNKDRATILTGITLTSHKKGMLGLGDVTRAEKNIVDTQVILSMGVFWLLLPQFFWKTHGNSSHF